MNVQATDASIEEHSLSEVPALRGWFDSPRPQGLKIDYCDETRIIEEWLGADRIINYSPWKEELLSEQEDVRKSLREYYDSLKKAEVYLKEAGFESVRSESDKSNIELCSFSNTFYLFDKPFLKLKYRLGHKFRSDAIFTEYDIPCWQIEFLHRGSLSVYHWKQLLKEEHSFEEWLPLLCREPKDANDKRNVIIDLTEEIFSFPLQNDDIVYDPTSNCYLLKKAAELQIISDLIPVHDTEPNCVAKYTSFETLIATMQSGKIRMNSLVSMNDKTETDILGDTIRNFKEEYESDSDKYLFANKEFITSFTSRIDELDMWRLYGDDAKGVCMVFKRTNKDMDKLYKIKYITSDNEGLKKVKRYMDALKSKDIRFHLWQLHQYRHFLKHSDYEAENEYRLLVKSNDPDGWFINRDNGILTPYIEKSIKNTDRPDNIYPLRLTQVILGPAIKEKFANLMQVFYLLQKSGYFFEISLSGINSYR
jgi:hypothetical protein